MGKISLSNIIDELAAKSGITRESSANFMHAFIAAIERGLQEDNIVKIKGLGAFKLQEVNDRDSVDVNTGERITIKGYRKVTFTPDSVMKELVNRPFAHFEPTELNDGFPVDEVPVELDVAAAEAPEVEVVEEIVNPVTEEPVAEESATEDSVVEEIVTGEPIAEAPIAEDPTSEEPVADEPVADAQVTDEPVLESASMQAEPVATKHLEPKNEKRRRGCFWKLLLLLFVVAAALALVYGYITLDGTAVEQEDAVVENEAITVRSNLEEELGAEWSNAPQVEKHQQIENEEVAVESVKQSDISAPVEQEAASAGKETPIITESEASKERPTEVAQPTKPDFCKVTPTEALQAKTVKDITLADTTDYELDGTLVTHRLKSGETIIQLANKYYGDKRLWPYIVKHNRMSDFNRVAIGQRIDIPVLKDKSVK
jgi:nucleoid DNA-binding protein